MTDTPAGPPPEEGADSDAYEAGPGGSASGGSGSGGSGRGGSDPHEAEPGGPAGSGPAPGTPDPGAEATVPLPTVSAVPAAASAATARVELDKETGGPGQRPGAHLHPPGPGEPGAMRAKRFWSGRRIPAALTAAAGLALSGLFLYDVASVRAGRSAMQWRRTLANELATRHLDSPWIILGASVCAALGLWLLVLALTPGERGVLPMARRGPAAVRAGLDRHAAELVLRDRAMEVPGVRWARAFVARRRIKVRATSHFRDLADVERDLGETMEAAVSQLGLARRPRLTLRVRHADKKA